MSVLLMSGEEGEHEDQIEEQDPEEERVEIESARTT